MNFKFSYFLYVSFMIVIFVALEAKTTFKEYCVIGAGPAGLQMGYFFKRANRDYVIFEKANVSGSFFIKFPRHRKLISINKRHTGRQNKEFNLRHDWNSLISDDESLLFTKYTKAYFPHADIMPQYLEDYRTKLGLNVQFNTEISNLTYAKGNNVNCRFTMEDQRKSQYCCKDVIVAIGIGKASRPEMRGQEFAEHYDTVTVDPEEYDGQSVLIIGRGNSGLELASSIYGYANFVHLLSRERVKFSWDTHYVGDIRAVNNEILDAYMLKSLDGIQEADLREMYIAKRDDGKLQVRTIDFEYLNTLDQSPFREGYDRVVLCTGFQMDKALFHNSTLPKASEIVARNQEGSRYPKGLGKFPDISHDYQSTQFPGMWFAGPLAHSLDFRKSAGGFIHGFRYTARALHNLLEWKNHRVPWPSVTKSWEQLSFTIMNRANEGSGIYQMFQHLCDVALINLNDETFTYLEDFPVNLVYELPDKSGHPFDPSKQALVVMCLEYGANFSKVGEDHFSPSRARGDPEDAHLCNFLHPIVYYYRELPKAEVVDSNARPSEQIDENNRTKSTLPKPDGIHHTVEDFTTVFDAEEAHLFPLRRFLEFFLEGDLRVFLAQSCIHHGLFTEIRNGRENLPLFCRKRYLENEESVLSYLHGSLHL